MKQTPVDTGKIIATIRKAQGKTLAAIATECGCTVSFLSKLENGHCKASLNTLHRIASSLGINVTMLMWPSQRRPPRIVRARGRQIRSEPHFRASDGVKLELISGADPANAFQVNLHHVLPGGNSDGQIVHFGDEFIYILLGEIELHINKKTHRLRKGDAAFFKSSEPHGYSNPTREEALILWLNSPPTY